MEGISKEKKAEHPPELVQAMKAMRSFVKGSITSSSYTPFTA
jgi:hypothetical protein